MSIWHLPEWFAESVWATNPVTSLCDFLGIANHDSLFPVPFSTLRGAAVVKCPDLDICRVIANASKHSKVDFKPNPDLKTFCYASFAHRGRYPFMRPVMWIRVDEGAIKRDMREVFHACFVFWSHLNFVSRPGTTWKKGDPLPKIELPMWVASDDKPIPKEKASAIRRLLERTFDRA